MAPKLVGTVLKKMLILTLTLGYVFLMLDITLDVTP